MEKSALQNQSNANYQYATQEQVQQKETTAPPSAKFNFSFAKQNKLDIELRKPRSRAYMEIFDAIDILSANDEEIIAKLKEAMDEDTFAEFSEMSAEELIEEIMLSFQEEFNTIKEELKKVMLGVISKCYINGCDCHAISSDGEILRHFCANEPMPAELEKGRIVFSKHPECKCVEIYSDCCIVVNADSTVTRIKNDEIY